MNVVWLSLLWAAEVQALDTQRTREDGYVVVSALMPHTVESVGAIFRQSGRTMRLGESVRSAKVTPLDNGCSEIEVVNKGFAKDLAYIAERCPIENGWHSKMKSSDDFEQHEIIWQALPHASGSTVSIRVKVSLKYPVPNFLVQRIVGGALEETLEKIDTIIKTEQKPSK